MATELHDLIVPPFARGFAAMAQFLEKGEAWASEQGAAPETLLTARLFPDMLPLTSQIQRASDTAKFAVARLSGITPPAMADTEASFADLQQRIAATVAVLHSVPRDQIDGREGVDVEVKTPSRTVHFKGLAYVTNFALPNFYFHVTTAYAILRANGVPIGKLDYLGSA